MISASILNADFARLGMEIDAAEAAGCDEIHVDVMDGRFVDALTFGMPIIEAVASITSLPIDVHMMVDEPARFAESYASVGTSIMTVHVEACADLIGTIDSIKTAGMRPAVSLNPPTSVDSIEHCLGEICRVLVMTVTPGQGGQPFMPELLPKLKRITRIRDERNENFEISVDGGINVDTATQAVKAGADVLVSGSAIFRHPDGVLAGVQALRSAIV